MWQEVMDCFNHETPEQMYFRVTELARPVGITVLEQWVFEKYIRTVRGITIMAKEARKSTSSDKAPTQAFRGFVNFDLDDEQYSAFDKVYPKSFPNAKTFEDVLIDYKMTVTPSRGQFNACLFPQDGPNAGYALSAFSDSAYEAMALVIFKLTIIHAWDWGSITKKTQRSRG